MMKRFNQLGFWGKTCKCNLDRFVSYSCLRFASSQTNIKSDIWAGLENTRTYVRGFVKEWNHDKGWGVLIDDNERDWEGDNQCKYYVHYTDIAGLNVPWLTVL